MTEYRVSIKTGSGGFLSFAGTDDKIFCRLTDINGRITPKIWLKDDDKSSFEKNSVDNFRFFYDNADFGDLLKCQVWKEGSDDWSLGTMLFTRKSDPEATFNFTFNETIKQKMVERFVDGTTANKIITYKIAVKTANVENAGTDGDVTLNIIGSNGQTLPRDLDNFKNNFEAGDTDKFEIKAIDVGKIEKIILSVSDKGINPDWVCESVTIRFGDPEERYYFAVNSVIKGGKSYEVSNPTYEKDEPVKPKKPLPVLHFFRGTVETSNKSMAGTDANVTIHLGDKNGKLIGPIKLKESGSALEKGAKDPIEISLIESFAELTTLQVQHDGKGVGSDWHLSQITLAEFSVHDKKTIVGEPKVFIFNEWIKANSPSTKTAAVPVKPEDPATPDYKTFLVGKVTTADKYFSGTDADVQMFVTDSNGVVIGPVDLKDSQKSKTMERGSVDIVMIQSTVEIADIYKVQVMHNGSGAFSNWGLNTIELKKVKKLPTKDEILEKNYLNTGLKVFSFNKSLEAGRWYDSGDDADCVDYEVLVQTAKGVFSGTFDKVQFNIIGDKGSTFFQTYDNIGADQNAGGKDKYTKRMVDLGALQKLVVKKSGNDTWKLDNIKITNKKNEHQWLFDNNGQEIKKKEVEIPAEQIKFGKNKIEGKVYTSDFQNAGTDATVTIKITDKSGKPYGPLDLVDKDKNAFERNTVNKINLLTLDRVTNIHKISICHNGKGAGPDWHLGYIELSLPGRETYKFEFDKWIKADRWYDAVPQGAPPAKNYTIAVETRNGGITSTYGTDNDVFINIVGKLGDSNMFQLKQKGKNLFEKGKTDVFERTMADLGDLLGVQVEKKGKINDQWHMQSIAISDGTRHYRSQNGPYEVNKDMVKVKLESVNSVQSQ